MSALPERTGRLVTHRNLKGVEQHLARRLWQVFGPETFQVELDGFLEVGLGILDGLSLAHGIQFHTPGDPFSAVLIIPGNLNSSHPTE